MKKNKRFYAIYQILKDDEKIKATFDYSNQVIDFFEKKIDINHFSTYIKNNKSIILKNKIYKIYSFEIEED